MKGKSENVKLEFLWNAANTLPAKTHTGSLLKSYYLTICRKISSQSKNDNNYKNKNHTTTQLFWDNDEKRMCTKCSSYWFDGNFTIKILKSTINKQKYKKKNNCEQLIESYQKGKCLTKMQKKHAKWLMKKLNSYMLIVCNVCKHRTKIPMKKSTKINVEKPINKTLENNAAAVEETQSNEVQITTDKMEKKKRKKKKKDKFAGLNIKTMESIKLKENTKNSTMQIASAIPSVSDDGDGNVKKKIVIPSVIKQSKNPTVQQSKSSLLPSSSSSSSLKKVTKNNSKLPIQKQKQKSKTQQQNVLLQLAQALKSGNATTNKNDRLKNLLQEK